MAVGIRMSRLVLAAVLVTGAASAQQSAPTIEQTQRQGIELLRRGQNEQALDLFRSLYGRTREPRALWRMGTAEAALGRWLEAEGHMRAAFESTGDSWIQSQRVVLAQTLRQVQARVGLLTVRCNIPGASIEVDGQPVTAFPLRVVAGDVRLTVRAEGYREATATITVPGSVERPYVQEINLLSLSRGAPSEPSHEAPSSGSHLAARTEAGPSANEAESQGPGALPWITLAAGGIGIGTSVALFALAGSAESRRNDACPGGICNDESARQRGDSADAERVSYQRAAIGTMIGGGTLVAGGVVWLLLTRSSHRSRAQTAWIPIISANGVVGVAGFL